MTTTPWYRHRWPWLLIAGPAAAIVAGAITTWIAFASADGLVAEDYYKQGMAINKVLARENRARELEIEAELALHPSRLAIELRGAEPEALVVHLAHSTRSGYDRRLRLAPAAPGLYEGALPELPPGRWRIVIEDPRSTWRIVKEKP